MNTARTCLSSSFALALLFIVSVRANLSAADPAVDLPRNRFDPRLRKFVAAKEQHARALAKEFQFEAAPEMWDYFEANLNGDWPTVRRLFRDLARRSRPSGDGVVDVSVHNLVWPPLMEAQLGYECFEAMDIKFVDAFARGVIDAIPRGEIYFGGTDPGRGVITAFVKSHAEADPFFVLPQNPLADSLYLQYLRAIYGKKISIPDEDDRNRAFKEYKTDAGIRLDEGRLKPGEQVFRNDGQIEFNGTVAIMEVNAILAKLIFDRNPKREFYVEESFVLDWMYPHLTPHGLILKLNRQPLSEISESAVQKDRDYWRRQTARFLGDWLKEETSLQTVCEFVERVYRDGDLEGFKGDALYVTAERNHSPRLLFGKLRHAQANLYEWRFKRAKAAAEKRAMQRAAELAYKQVLALCPDSPEYVRRLVVWLREQDRLEDARRVLEAGRQINPGSKRLGELADELKAN